MRKSLQTLDFPRRDSYLKTQNSKLPQASGANEIAELHCAGFTVNKGVNALGIAAASARLETGTLRILPGACPRLLAEAELYCYSTDPGRRHAEIPEDANNHALGDAAT
ncbi:MAG TPA: hypothetical protein VGG61_04715 [Gemmataceae bacterium]|jgi:hypothetical protein